MIENAQIIEAVNGACSGAVLADASFRSQLSLTVDPSRIVEVCKFLRDDETLDFDMLTELTAVDYMGREKRFQVVYILYSFANNQRLCLKTDLAEGETIATVESVWKAANWLEREVFDLFGIVFDDHTDLRRILLWDGYVGHPLRKDFPLMGIEQKVLYKKG